MLRGAELLAWLARIPPRERDAAAEAYLGIEAGDADTRAPGEHLTGYHPSGVAPIVRAMAEVPVAPDDVVIDVGAGLGKVAFLAHLLTGAAARGIELQRGLVDRAQSAAARLGLPVHFARADAREASLDDGTVFFLYAPFTGPVLSEVLGGLRAVAARRQIVVCALGIDLHREAPWLSPRPTDSFWLTIYDSAVPGAAPRAPRASALALHLTAAIAHERPAPPEMGSASDA